VRKYVDANKTNLLLEGKSVYVSNQKEIVSFFADKVVKENFENASTQKHIFDGAKL
jgi:hypothetical protein